MGHNYNDWLDDLWSLEQDRKKSPKPDVDVYSKIATEYGLDRQYVKSVCLFAAYGKYNKQNNDLETACRNAIEFLGYRRVDNGKSKRSNEQSGSSQHQ